MGCGRSVLGEPTSLGDWSNLACHWQKETLQRGSRQRLITSLQCTSALFSRLSTTGFTRPVLTCTACSSPSCRERSSRCSFNCWMGGRVRARHATGHYPQPAAFRRVTPVEGSRGCVQLPAGPPQGRCHRGRWPGPAGPRVPCVRAAAAPPARVGGAPPARAGARAAPRPPPPSCPAARGPGPAARQRARGPRGPRPRGRAAAPSARAPPRGIAAGVGRRR